MSINTKKYIIPEIWIVREKKKYYLRFFENKINECISYFHLISSKTYIVLCEYKYLEKNRKYIDIIDKLKPRDKYSYNNLFNFIKKNHNNNNNIFIKISLFYGLEKTIKQKIKKKFLKYNIYFIKEKTIEKTSFINVNLYLNTKDRKKKIYQFIEWCSKQNEIFWIEIVKKIQHFNQNARIITQNHEFTKNIKDKKTLHFFNFYKLDGSDQIVGCGDSGIRIDSCFFKDHNHNVTFIHNQEKNYHHQKKKEKILHYYHHRKIIVYRSYQDNDDGYGHGTHVAASIIGDPLTNDKKIIQFQGMAPKARLVFSDLGKGNDDSLTLGDISLYDYFQFHYDMGARINSDSWGWPDVNSEYGSNSAEMDRFVWDHPDFLAVFACGNGDGIAEPAVAKNILTVGVSKNNINEIFVVSDFSSRGPTADGRVKPEIIAPGDPVYSADYKTECGIKAMSGTSMATPIVAGNMVLLRQFYQKYYSIKSPSAALLKGTAILATIQNNKILKHPESYGYGLFKPFNILSFHNKGNLFIFDNINFKKTNQIHLYTCILNDIGIKKQKNKLKIILTWTDLPGHVLSKYALINDLDLIYNADNNKIKRIYKYTKKNGKKNNIEIILDSFEKINKKNISFFIKANKIHTKNQKYSLLLTGSFLICQKK